MPFDAESAVTVALKQVSETPLAPRRRNPAVPPELERIVLRALAKDPADRFADADEFIAALQAVSSRLPTQAVIAAAEAAAASLPPVVMRPIPPPRPIDTGVFVPVEAQQRRPVTVAPLAPAPARGPSAGRGSCSPVCSASRRSSRSSWPWRRAA